MSKNIKKDKDNSAITNILEGNIPTTEHADYDRDNDGMITLKRTAKGEEKMKEFIARRSKKRNVPDEKPKVSYDGTKVREVLDEAVELVKAGKYGKAAKLDISEVIKFADEFVNLKETDKDYEKTYKMAMELMAIGKSFYEYSDIQFINDSHYDTVRNKYQKLGLTEPNAIIPKGAKNLKKVALTYPTLSNNVDKAYVINEDDPVPEGVKESDSVEAFLKRAYKALDLKTTQEIEIEVSPKLDGVSINGTIKGSSLMNPQTRGGDSESVSIGGMNGILVGDEDLDNDKTFGIQYECFVTEEDRVKASEYLKLDTPYVSCRHAAAGITHRLATMEDDDLLEYLSFYPIATEGLDGTYGERVDYIQSFAVTPKDMLDRKVLKGNLEDLLIKISKRFGYISDHRAELSYPIDGMVITIFNDDYQKKLGRSGRTNRFQIALKFDPANAIAVVDHVDLEAGDKGYRTIQVYFKDAVIVDGVRYDHVPVLSKKLFDDLGLCKKSEVMVHRVGDVIPSITKKSDGNGVKLDVPTKCPSCGETLKVIGKKLYCDNPYCRDNVIGRFVSFFKTMGLDDYNQSFAADLVDNNVRSIKTMIDLDVDDLKERGITGKRAEAFPKAIKKAFETKPDYVVVAAIGIPNIGKERAKKLLSVIPLEKFAKDEFISIHLETPLLNAFGVIGMNIYHDIMFHLETLKEIYPYVKNITKDFENTITVGHTGGAIEPEAMKVIEDHGFMTTDGKKFDVLIIPEWGHKSTKADIAFRKDIPILTNEAFVDMYKDYDGVVSKKKDNTSNTEPKKTKKVSTSDLTLGPNIW